METATEVGRRRWARSASGGGARPAAEKGEMDAMDSGVFQGGGGVWVGDGLTIGWGLVFMGSGG